MEDCYTELEKAVVVLVENFYKYVSKHSLVKNKISKSSFRKMLQRELNHMLTVRPPRPPAPASPEGACRTAASVPQNHGPHPAQASALSPRQQGFCPRVASPNAGVCLGSAALSAAHPGPSPGHGEPEGG